MKLPICDITAFTLQDFPDHTACIMWFAGCNMRCRYCHNPELIYGKKQALQWSEITAFLKSRLGLIDGVVLSGGECTLSPYITDFISMISEMGYKVKLDTNGLKPDILHHLLERKLLDFVALDYKAPFAKFSAVTGNAERDFQLFWRSLELLCEYAINSEIRTTVHTDLLNEGDIINIIQDLRKLGYKGNYYIQNFTAADDILGELPKTQAYTLQKQQINDIANSEEFRLGWRNFH